ncbi:Cof-type HAD-IIB family hydrolase [Subdoligranulum variabile]|uniref:Cof-like hydrolase n=1 Tax=Subdoligranulum variabile DSM 15176 TaxID=411471 RepID=D1PP54_9FIRM|nr:Cof-type HAD-IIB family hydrolase [Subdoligranulum variabile]EFB75550.1 Cof-like hydrolase [Subdoligranulum variabile DSM 15176]UWP68996.1 Cof-type HAD-IIB family hydrolase [Subdoligranulum variabile]
MSKIRLVALDLDGTVFNDEKQISPRTLDAIRAALAKGVDVLPATGRTVTGVPRQFAEIPGVRYALTSNGASVVDLQTGEKLVCLPFDAALAERAFDVVRPFGGMLSVFINGESYTAASTSGDGLEMVPENLREYFRTTRNVVPDMHRMMEEHPHEIEKFSILYPTEAQRDAAWQAVAAACPTLEITSSIERNMELNAPGVSKGPGLMALAKRLGLAREQVMAVGDSGNDRTMVELAGLGVAMGNATEEIRQAADVITADNNHDGVAEAIEKYVL